MSWDCTMQKNARPQLQVSAGGSYGLNVSTDTCNPDDRAINAPFEISLTALIPL